ncbi:MAG: ribosome maturation factor RimP [Kocuria sp.]|nr:ribosome maturation factor RimP [Kocuria sp.]
MSVQEMEQQLRVLLEPVVEKAGMYLEGVSIRAMGASRVLQVLVDLPEDTTEPVDLDHVATVSRAISEVLDQHDAVAGPAYELEVSSPGAGRELTEVRHWKRSLGRRVALTPLDLDDGEKFVAQLLSVEPGEGLEDTVVTVQRSKQVKKGMPVKVMDPERWQLTRIRRAAVVV